MGAKKALRKLKKQKEKLKTESARQLMELAKSTVSSDDHPSTQRQHALSADLKAVSKEALTSMASELAVPFNPLLSWFNEGSIVVNLRNSNDSEGKQTAIVTAPTVKSITHLPLKSPPCKRCPALQNGICKCAAKKLQQHA
ncbi:hypothetical protein [Veronia pacifica]|uniref:Uncharacterized protein n=1 Tax=Veronia pacifica TaxID=1080227 RepID=A0A1C3ES50_9GAMM|nr:hypothetical protein [Veronia pacifica]ODA36066.1 hypothetical protein A8L45_00205 [Veronia pacifica]